MHEAPTKSGSKLLPANAYTKLKPGEEYQPIVPASDLRPEVTAWSISLGLIMVVIFSAACVYMALRAGNAIEASIPIAILAIFFGKMKKVRSTILENVMVQSIGQAAGVAFAGAGPDEIADAVMAMAEIAGIQAAKQTPSLLPLCHPIALNRAMVHSVLRQQDHSVEVYCVAEIAEKTGVEMEALTGASVAALTVYDMCKALSHDIVISETRLMMKTGGKEDFHRDD